MKFSIECEREEDGRRLAAVPQSPWVLTYRNTADEALAKAEVLARRVLAERLAHGEARPVGMGVALARVAQPGVRVRAPKGSTRRSIFASAVACHPAATQRRRHVIGRSTQHLGRPEVLRRVQ